MSAVDIRIAMEITQAQKRIAQLENRLTRFEQKGTKSLGKFGKAGNEAFKGMVQSAGLARVSLAGASYAVSRFVSSSFQEFARLQKGWAEVTTLMPQQTKAMTDSMNAEMRKLAKDTGKHLGDVYQAAYEAVSAGVPAEATPEFMRIATDAAIGGVTDMTTAVDGLTTVLNTYNLSMDKTSLVSDQFFTAVRLGKTTLPLLAYNVAQVTPIAEAMGIGFDQVAAGLAALTAQGRPTAQAATQIRAALDQMSDAETKVGKLFREEAGVSFPEFLDAGGTMREAMVIVVNAAERAGKQVAEVFGRVEGALGALGLASEASARIHEDYMTDIEGSTAEAAQKMKETWQFQIDVVKAQWLDMKNWFAENVIAAAINVVVNPPGESLADQGYTGPATRRVGPRGSEVYYMVQGKEVSFEEFRAHQMQMAGQQSGIGRYGPNYSKPSFGDVDRAAIGAGVAPFDPRYFETYGYQAGFGKSALGRFGSTGDMESYWIDVMEQREKDRVQRERDEKARMEAMWGTQWAAWARGDTPDMEYFGQLRQKRDYLGGLETREGVQVQEEINRLVLATETKADDDIFWVNLRSDDKPDRMLRAQRGPIRGRPRGACG